MKKKDGKKGDISRESLAHFRCGSCGKWWTIGDAPRRERWFCPWCGVSSVFRPPKN